MKTFLYIDEDYPVYYLSEDAFTSRIELEISSELKEKYLKAYSQWNEVQTELSHIYRDWKYKQPKVKPVIEFGFQYDEIGKK